MRISHYAIRFLFPLHWIVFGFSPPFFLLAPSGDGLLSRGVTDASDLKGTPRRAGHSVQTRRGIGRRRAMPPSWFLEPCNVGRTAIHLGWPSSTIATQAEEYIHWFHVTKKPKLYWLGISWMKVLQVFNKDMRFLLGLSACHHLSWALANYWKAAVHFRGNVI